MRQVYRKQKGPWAGGILSMLCKKDASYFLIWRLMLLFATVEESMHIPFMNNTEGIKRRATTLTKKLGDDNTSELRKNYSLTAKSAALMNNKLQNTFFSFSGPQHLEHFATTALCLYHLSCFSSLALRPTFSGTTLSSWWLLFLFIPSTPACKRVWFGAFCVCRYAVYV